MTARCFSMAKIENYIEFPDSRFPGRTVIMVTINAKRWGASYVTAVGKLKALRAIASSSGVPVETFSSSE